MVYLATPLHFFRVPKGAAAPRLGTTALAECSFHKIGQLDKDSYKQIPTRILQTYVCLLFWRVFNISLYKYWFQPKIRT
jgi:hypothetical protein